MPDDESSSPVYLLGAGFSRAISENMPLLDDLGQALATVLTEDRILHGLLNQAEIDAIEDGRVPFGNVEAWLTSLAADQPFLSLARNLQRRALYGELASLIAQEIRDRQRLAGQQPWPRWFDGLLACWQEHKSDVLTLNYDTIIESVSMTLKLKGSGAELPWPNDIVGSFPPAPPQQGSWGEETMTSFSLHKLHGSTNWFGRSGSSDMLSIVRFDRLVPEWGSEERPLDRAMSAVRDSMQVMLLPPVADKSELCRNATMAVIWQRALEALKRTNRLIVFGYSIPPTDTSILALLATGVRRDARVTIVDPTSHDVAGPLEALGLVVTEMVDPPDAESPFDWPSSL